MNKYLYKIKDLEIPTHLKYWFARKSKINFDLSEILNGTSFDLTNTVNKKLHLINIFGNSVQNGEPTPENPIEIKSTGDNGYIVEKFVNKNLFDGKNPIYINGKILNNNGIEIPDNSGGYTKMYINIKPNTIYIISGLTSQGSKRVYFFDKNKNFIARTDAKSNSYIQFTTPNNCYYIDFQYYKENNDFSKWQLEEGTTATTYVEHQEQLYTIPCQQPMRAIGDVKDTFVKVNGVWYERHNIGEFIANNNLLGNGITDDRVNLRTPTLNIAVNLGGDAFKSKVMCNLLQKTIINNTGLAGTTSTGEIRVVLSKDYVTTYAEANTYLTEKGLKIYWAMEEPIDLPCTQAQITALEALMKARTYKNITHIYSEDEVPADLEIQYYKEKEEE